MLQILSHLGVAILAYLVLENNPKIKKTVDSIFTKLAVPFNFIKNRVKSIFKKND